jgi:hypothetical protein
MDNKILLVVVVVALVAGAGGFFGGMQYQKSQRQMPGGFQAMREQFRGGEGPQGAMQFGQGEGRPVSGEIISSDENSITVKLPDGSSRIVFVGDETKISESTPSAKNRLTAGTPVFVTGSENSDGSLTATSIQIGN